MPFWNNLGGTIRLKGIEIYPILVAINAAKFSFGAILELKNGEKEKKYREGSFHGLSSYHFDVAVWRTKEAECAA